MDAQKENLIVKVVIVLFMSTFLLGVHSSLGHADEIQTSPKFQTLDDFRKANALSVANGTGIKYFFSPNGHVTAINENNEYVDVTPPHLAEQADRNSSSGNPFDAFINLLSGTKPAHDGPPPTPGDYWNFLPDYQPGNLGEDPMPSAEADNNPPSVSAVGHEGTTPNVPTAPDVPARPALGESMINEIEAREGTLDPMLKAGLKNPDGYFQPSPDRVNDLLGSFDDPLGETSDLDQAKYGGTIIWDSARRATMILDKTSGKITQIMSTGMFTGESGTMAVTTLDGKTVNVDYYNDSGHLVRSVATNPANGDRTITTMGTDGNWSVEEIHADGTPFHKEGTSTDPTTGVKTTSVGNADGSRDVTTTDKDGNVIDKRTEGGPADPKTDTKSDSDPIMEGTSTDPVTGVTTTSVGNPDGTRTVTRTDASGLELDRRILGNPNLIDHSGGGMRPIGSFALSQPTAFSGNDPFVAADNLGFAGSGAAGGMDASGIHGFSDDAGSQPNDTYSDYHSG